jgi:predicted unusual protein kinase regulating ubiquinone biosynthesis (AarF/ABC1/UbiB family)
VALTSAILTAVGDRDRDRRAAERKVGLAKLFARAKQILTTDPGSDDDDRVAADAEAGALAKQAAQLKAGMAKLGQLAAYEPHVDAAGASPQARAKLAALWDHAPALSAAEISRVVEAELGMPPQAAFAKWDPTPIAAASLGQVHAATGHDGASYAVKVQYPGIADALRADLASEDFARKLAGIDHLTADATAALRAAILGELDYAREAAALERFAAAYRDDPAIRIPRVDRARSTRRVLTMERATGTPWAAAAALPAETRDAAARTVARFAFGAPLVHGICNADPNPGNYLVDGDRVWFLDFGCTIELSPDVVAGERDLWWGLLDGDAFAGAERFRVALQTLGLLRRAASLSTDAHREWEALLAAPLAPAFTFTPTYASALATAFRRVLQTGGLTLHAPTFLLWRQRLGIIAVLGMLSPTIALRAILADLIGTGRKAL